MVARNVNVQDMLPSEPRPLSPANRSCLPRVVLQVLPARAERKVVNKDAAAARARLLPLAGIWMCAGPRAVRPHSAVVVSIHFAYRKSRKSYLVSDDAKSHFWRALLP